MSTMTMILTKMALQCLNSRTVRLATPPSDKLLSLTSGINSNLTALLSLLQVYCHCNFLIGIIRLIFITTIVHISLSQFSLKDYPCLLN